VSKLDIATSGFMAAVLSRTRIDFYREGDLACQVSLLDKLGKPNDPISCMRVLEGHACATPPGVNPFVELPQPLRGDIEHPDDTGCRAVRARGQGQRHLCAWGIIPWA
jgi:hypothetical protein